MNRLSWRVLQALAVLSIFAAITSFFLSFLPPPIPRSGKEVFITFCKSCHLHGSTGAPQINSKESWQKRKVKGMKVLTEHAMKGFKGMPKRGTCLNCTEVEIERAINYMIKESSQLY